MKTNYLEWDSNFFDKKIGEIFLSTKDEIIFTEDNYDLIVVKQKIEFDLDLKGYDVTFSETKIIYEKALKIEDNITDNIVQDTDSNEKQAEFFKQLAYESGKKSRFLLDEQFGESKFSELYDQWIINSLNKKFADKTFFIEKNNFAIGFVTVQIKGDLGKIGLIATHPNHQGQGLGKILLKKAEQYCVNNGCTQMEIPTQKQNVQACNFYEKQGYSIQQELIIKHYWK